MQIGRFEQVVAQDKRDSMINYVVNKVIPPKQIRLTMEQIRVKVARREQQRRQKLQAIFLEEKQQYDVLALKNTQH